MQVRIIKNLKSNLEGIILLMNIICELSSIYSEYKIFPLNTFHQNTPLKVFQAMFPENHYKKDMDVFLIRHDYRAIRRGSDLPWWGENYFKNSSDKKAMIVSQDSLSSDSGSVAFYAHIMQELISEEEYKSFYRKLHKEYQKFGYGNWSKIREMIINWGLGFENIYVTDASKVYTERSSTKFDIEKSRELLKREIEYCNPDILILLGWKPLDLLAKEFKYSDVVDKCEILNIEGINTVVCPFPVGNGRSQKNFNQRMDNSKKLIRQLTQK